MDSAIFLASLFLFGFNITLLVLFFNSIIIAFTQKDSAWWKHVLNFSNYTLMIVLAYYSFIFTGGEIGSGSLTTLSPYIVSLTTYLLTNILLVAVFFLLSESNRIVPILKGMFKDTITTYVCTLFLSMILVILIHAQSFFGLFLFSCITLLLAQTFRQNFKLYKAVSHKANIDELTGLNNHGYFKELLEIELLVAKDTEAALCIAILDIDDFKKYNDLHGHIQGDVLLNEFGALLKTECEKKKFSVARYGGEEFSIIMPNTLLEDAFDFIDDLRRLTNDTPLDGVQVLPYGCLSFSAGIAEWEKKMYNSAELLNKADQALYKAKNLGKNHVRYYNQHSEYPTIQQSTAT
ncbi:MAG: GGDEF domain-containing protein [Bacillota bacterium]